MNACDIEPLWNDFPGKYLCFNVLCLTTKGEISRIYSLGETRGSEKLRESNLSQSVVVLVFSVLECPRPRPHWLTVSREEYFYLSPGWTVGLLDCQLKLVGFVSLSDQSGQTSWPQRDTFGLYKFINYIFSLKKNPPPDSYKIYTYLQYSVKLYNIS